MLEVVFGDSAAGSLLQALAGEPREIEQGIPLFHMEELSPEEHARLWEEDLRWQQEREARQRRGWAEGLPMTGSPVDIIPLSLHLSVGEITEEGIGPQRQAALEGLMGTYPSMAQEVAEELLQRSRESLAAILARAGGGEGVRVWTSSTPDDTCGLAWLVHQLAALDLEKVQVTQVKLPDFYERSDGTVVQWRNWGEMDPWMWGRMVGLGQRLPVNLLRGLDAQWRALQRENAPMRAVLNGELVSVPETWYDPFLQKEIAAEEEEFMAARVIGKVLGKYQLGIGDGELAQRMQAMIRAGQLQQVTYPSSEDPIYHCRLRKTPGVWNK